MKSRRNDAGDLRCPTCDRWLRPEEFHVDRSRADGRTVLCKGCKAIQKREQVRRQRELHPSAPPGRRPRAFAPNGDQWCRGCQAYLPRERFNPAPETRLRRCCALCETVEQRAAQAKRNARRAEERARQAPAAPAPEPTPIGGWPGGRCWVADGEYIVRQLRGEKVAMRIVRGWEASVPKGAEGWVEPTFPTRESAALFMNMIRHLTGVRIEQQLARREELAA